ncbi:MAG: hypothetical protein V4678_02230 [Patescibacteria group bacterium]
MQPRLVIEQKITAFVNKYKVLNVNEAGDSGQLIALAQQKRLAFKEKVQFFTDEQKSAVAFTFRAEKIMDVHGRYIVEDTDGTVVGMFRKEFKKSLLVSSWVLMDADGTELFRVKESNVTIAVLRRFIGFVPLIGDLLDIALNFFKYHFSFTDIQSDQEVGKYEKTTLFRDYYRLSVEDSAWARLDWRVFAAMGVALDALQSR